MKNSMILLFFIFLTNQLIAQTADETTIRRIYDEALSKGRSYEMLEYLTTKVGPRLSGSPGAAAAVEWSRNVMEEFGFDTVYLQPVMVPHWVRGEREMARIINSKKMGTVDLAICALGNSVGTGPSGITANVVEVKNFDELKLLGEAKIKGKIVFF
jgi:carboxypeptidase Q